MGRKVVEVEMWQCDGCFKEIASPPGKKPQGFGGTVTYVDRAGSSQDAEWFACSSRCIRSAVAGVLGLDTN